MASDTAPSTATDKHGMTTWMENASNYPNRPHALAIWKSDGLTLQDLRLVQSQMWSVAIMHSKNVVADGVHISSQSDSDYLPVNTDGFDTIDCDQVTFRNLYIRNGDDAIAIKGNSTNILVEDSTFQDSIGLAFGSLGQYERTYETVNNVTAQNISFIETTYVAYVKTWSGDPVNEPPNGGGGGTGKLSGITITDMEFTELSDSPFYITQCTTFSGGDPDCDSSLFEITDITIQGWSGDTWSEHVARLECAEASGGCTGITIEDVTATSTEDGYDVTAYSCDNVSDATGFECGE